MTTGREPNASSAQQQLSDACPQAGLLLPHAPVDQCEDLRAAGLRRPADCDPPSDRTLPKAHPQGQHDTGRGRTDHDHRRAR